MVYEPGHAYADSKGFVAYPGVNHTAEMLTLNSALRAYEANVAAMSAAKAMAAWPSRPASGAGSPRSWAR